MFEFFDGFQIKIKQDELILFLFVMRFGYGFKVGVEQGVAEGRLADSRLPDAQNVEAEAVLNRKYAMMRSRKQSLLPDSRLPDAQIVEAVLYSANKCFIFKQFRIKSRKI